MNGSPADKSDRVSSSESGADPGSAEIERVFGEQVSQDILKGIGRMCLGHATQLELLALALEVTDEKSTALLVKTVRDRVAQMRSRYNEDGSRKN
jgi:hypothetical protein